MPSEDELRAIGAGLAIAWRDHPADVTEAIAHAKRLAGAFRRPADPAAEPIPPYAATSMPPPPKPRRAKGAGR